MLCFRGTVEVHQHQNNADRAHVHHFSCCGHTAHLRVSLRCSIQTQEPMSLSLRVTARATPPPPATRMLALSGSSCAASTLQDLRACLQGAIGGVSYTLPAECDCSIFTAQRMHLGAKIRKCLIMQMQSTYLADSLCATGLQGLSTCLCNIGPDDRADRSANNKTG